MSEGASEVIRTLSHPKLEALPNNRLSFGTLRSLVGTFRGLSDQERGNVQTFVRKAVEGPGYVGGSLGAFGKGEAAATYDLLSDRVEESALREMAEKLEQGGEGFRLPLAVVRSIIHKKSPYEGFEGVQIGVSPDVINFSLCPDAEGFLYNAMRFNGANLVSFNGETVMLAKLHEAFGKSVALPIKSIGPFVEGILYSPAEVQNGQAAPVRKEVTNPDLPIPLGDVARTWYIGRPVRGSVPPILSPYVEQQDAMTYFKENIPRYPFPPEPELNLDF